MHHEAASGAARSHPVVQLAHHVDADPKGPPLLALHEKRLASTLVRLRQDKIDTTIGAASARFDQLVALHPGAFTDQHFELAPGYAVECVDGLAWATLTTSFFLSLGRQADMPAPARQMKGRRNWPTLAVNFHKVCVTIAPNYPVGQHRPPTDDATP